MLDAFRLTPDALLKLVGEFVTLSTPRGRLLAISGGAGLLTLLGADRLEGQPSLCLISKVIRRPCPACGITRALACLLRNDFGRAKRYNRLVWPVAAILYYLFLDDLRQVLRKYKVFILTPDSYILSLTNGAN